MGQPQIAPQGPAEGAEWPKAEAMGDPRPREKRFSPRRRVPKKPPGRLISVTGIDGEREIEYLPLDVSSAGFGVFSEEELEPDEVQFLLVMEHATVRLEVVWHQESPGDRVGYRYGLKVVDPDVDLKSLFEEAGCF